MVADDSLATGIDRLDSQTIEGIPKGSTIALLADPKAMGNLFLVRIANTERDTHYATITRDKESIKRELTHARKLKDKEDRKKLGEVNLYANYQSQNSLKNNLEKYVSRPKKGDNLILDNLSMIHERLSEKEYEKLIRNIMKTTIDRKGLTILLLLTDDVKELSMKERDMLNTVDGVFKFTSEFEQGQKRKDKLKIYKLRGKKDVIDEVVNIIIGKEITVSSSQKI